MEKEGWISPAVRRKQVRRWDRRCWWEVEVGWRRGQHVETLGGWYPSYDLTRCSGRCEMSGSTVMPGVSLKETVGPPNSSKGREERAVRPRSTRSVCAMWCLCCVCFGVGETNEINWEKGRVQMAANVAVGGREGVR